MEAAIVRQIFTLLAAGAGLTRITKTLNDAAAPAPRPQQGRPASWVNGSVREVLRRPLYRGEIVWNQTQKRDGWGQMNRRDRTADEVLRVAAPALRIVTDDLWYAAQAQCSARRITYARGDRPHIGSRYLLSGFARCASCGGGFAAHSRSHGGRRQWFYGCTSHWKRGNAVCRNGLVARMEILDDEILSTLQDDVCRPAIIEESIRLALEELAPARVDRECARLAKARAAAHIECERLADAIAQGGPLTVLLTRLQRAQERRDEADAALAALEARDASRVNVEGLEARLRAKLADWRGLLRRNVESGRDVLRALLVGPLVFTPTVDDRRRGYAFNGTITLDRLLSGVVNLPTGMASPTSSARFPIGELRRALPHRKTAA